MPKISNRVIGCAMEVHRQLGSGFFEVVHEKSLLVEFENHGIHYQRQVPFHIDYKGRKVGTYVADIVVEANLLLELKAASRLTPLCEAQLLNYLTASGIGVGLLINFGSKSLQLKRMATNYKLARII